MTTSTPANSWRKLVIGSWLAVQLAGAARGNLLNNGGFEVGSTGDNFAAIQGWPIYWGGEWGGVLADGSAQAPYSGLHCLKLNAYGGASGTWEKGLGQGFPAVPGQIYSFTGAMVSPAGPNRFAPSNGVCVLRLEFFNQIGVSLGGENATPLFGQNGPTDWTVFASGPILAPAGTVTGRCFILHWPGGDRTEDQFVYVDDVAVNTTAVERSGAIANPGFEIRTGAPLTLSGIPFWTAFGDGGAVTTERARSGQRSLLFWYPGSLVGQSWTVSPGLEYAAGAYLSSTNFTSTNAFGIVIMQYLDNTGTNIVGECLSPRFDANTGSTDWRYYGTSGIAPTNAVTARMLVGIVGTETDYGSSVMYADDALQVGPLSTWAAWQWRYFTATSGEAVAESGDFDGDGFANWSEFIAGTDPTQRSSCLALQPAGAQGAGAVIRWPSVSGRIYRVERTTQLVQRGFEVLSSGVPATPPANVYTDAAPPAICFYRLHVITNQP